MSRPHLGRTTTYSDEEAGMEGGGSAIASLDGQNVIIYCEYMEDIESIPLFYLLHIA